MNDILVCKKQDRAFDISEIPALKENSVADRQAIWELRDQRLIIAEIPAVIGWVPHSEIPIQNIRLSEAGFNFESDMRRKRHQD